MIETDVQVTKDGYLILMHDPMLDRTTHGHGIIEKMTLQEIEKIKLKNEEEIPLLEDFLKRYGQKIQLNIELKSKHIEKEVYTLIKMYNLIEDVILSSFSFRALENLHQIDEKLHLSWISKLSEYRLKTAISYKKFINTGIKYIQPLHYSTSEPFMKKAHQSGLMVFPWPVNSKPLAIKFKNEYGVDGIISKFPDLMEKRTDFNPVTVQL